MAFSLKILSNLRKLAASIAKPDIIFYCLPWLMVLVVLGTVSQKYVGLYVATEKYINSFIWWLGPIPLPGGLLVIGIIFIALFVKFLFFSKWNVKQSGIILTHLGVLLLLLGGLVTALSGREGFMIIPEGQSINAVSDYRERVLVFENQDGVIKKADFETLKNGEEITAGELTIKILNACRNASAQAPSGKYEDLQGLAVNMEIFCIPDEKNIEANFSGLVFAAQNTQNSENDGTYIVMEDIPKNPEIGGITIKLERHKEVLPFSIQLQDFQKINYPGTNKAREFLSDIVIEDGEISWPVRISMNEPLRYKGYSFFQSSFDQSREIEVTVLNVVYNKAWIFPYISTLIIFAGLLIHFVIRLQTAGGKR